MSFLDTFFLFTLFNINELHNFEENTLVKFLNMPKGGVQNSNLLGNSH